RRGSCGGRSASASSDAGSARSAPGSSVPDRRCCRWPRLNGSRPPLSRQVPLDRAAGGARPGLAAPATAAEHPRHLRSSLAGLPFNLRPAVPQRLLPVRGGSVVPGLVPPSVFGLVGELPVQLDDHAEGFVHTIASAPPPARWGERHLPGRP